MIFVTKYISYCDSSYVRHPLAMPHSSPAMPFKPRTTYGTHLLVHQSLPRAPTSLVCKQLELVRGMMGLGDVHTVAGGVAVGVLVVHIVAHNRSLLFCSGSVTSRGM